MRDRGYKILVMYNDLLYLPHFYDIVGKIADILMKSIDLQILTISRFNILKFLKNPARVLNQIFISLPF